MYKEKFLEMLKETRFIGIYHDIKPNPDSDLIIPMKNEEIDGAMEFFSIRDIVEEHIFKNWYKFDEGKCIGLEENIDFWIQASFKRPIIFWFREGYTGQIFPSYKKETKQQF